MFLRLGHRPHVVDHVAKAPFHEAERDDALGFELLRQHLAYLAVEHLVRLRLVRVQKRQVVDLERGFDLRHHRVRDHRRIERAEAQALQHRLLVAELPVGKEPHLYAPVGLPLNRLLEQARARGIRVLRRVGRGPADLDDMFRLRVRAAESEAEGRRRGGNDYTA